MGWLAFPTVGAVIVSRQPGNVIGWLFCAVGASSAILVFGEPYAIYALVTRPGSLPGGAIVAATPQWDCMPHLCR